MNVNASRVVRAILHDLELLCALWLVSHKTKAKIGYIGYMKLAICFVLMNVNASRVVRAILHDLELLCALWLVSHKTKAKIGYIG